MIFCELHETDRPVVVIERRGTDGIGGWSRIEERVHRGIIGGDANRIEVRAEVFFAERDVLQQVKSFYGAEIEIGETLKSKLSSMELERERIQSVVEISLPSEDSIREIQSELSRSGFARKLKSFQIINLFRIVSLPHAADFSVPGSGKTTVALANFALQKHRGEVQRLLVVAPLAAFEVWKEESKECFEKAPRVYFHLGDEREISESIDILVTNYHRLASNRDVLRRWAEKAKTHIILDEAHRVKRGREGVHGRAALDITFSADRRDILTGTPAPQGAHDLVPLIRFLYPGEYKQILPQETYTDSHDTPSEVLEKTHSAISKYFVRTRKSDLDLPPTTIEVISKPMGAIQNSIYEALVGKYRGAFRLDEIDRKQFRRIGWIIMYLLEAATNPSLLTAGSDVNDLKSFKHDPLKMKGDENIMDLLSRYNQYETPWKYDEVLRIVQESAKSGEKVLIWTSFIRNILHLKNILEDYNPAMVHGGVPPRSAVSSPSIITREDELDRFRSGDSGCSVLLANPAACGEGISLHHWCHRAVYLDRTFNAGHFLQSQDRIHRIGLKPETQTTFQLLVSEGSIDESVNQRLGEKIKTLSALMNDPKLVQISLPTDELSGEEYDQADEDVDVRDAEVVIKHIDGATS